LSYVADTQTNKQTNKNRQKHHLLGGGNNNDNIATAYSILGQFLGTLKNEVNKRITKTNSFQFNIVWYSLLRHTNDNEY